MDITSFIRRYTSAKIHKQNRNHFGQLNYFL
jgi:hypothetical protein